MSKPLRTEEEAVQEIEDAARWYERQRPGLGTELLAATDIILEQVSRFPKAGAFVSHVSRDLGVRRDSIDLPYPLITPTGRSRATLRASPASWTTWTTLSTSL